MQIYWHAAEYCAAKETEFVRGVLQVSHRRPRSRQLSLRSSPYEVSLRNLAHPGETLIIEYRNLEVCMSYYETLKMLVYWCPVPSDAFFALLHKACQDFAMLV